MGQVAGTPHYDLEVVAEMSGRVGEFRGICQDVLLVGCSRIAGYLGAALEAPERVLPYRARVEFPTLDQEARATLPSTSVGTQGRSCDSCARSSETR
jgi:hypothetical protein